MMGKKIIAIENPTCGIEGVKYKKHMLAAAINMQIIQKKNSQDSRRKIPKRCLCIKFIIRD